MPGEALATSKQASVQHRQLSSFMSLKGSVVHIHNCTRYRPTWLSYSRLLGMRPMRDRCAFGGACCRAGCFVPPTHNSFQRQRSFASKSASRDPPRFSNSWFVQLELGLTKMLNRCSSNTTAILADSIRPHNTCLKASNQEGLTTNDPRTPVEKKHDEESWMLWLHKDPPERKNKETLCVVWIGYMADRAASGSIHDYFTFILLIVNVLFSPTLL